MGKRLSAAAWVQQEADRIARRYVRPVRDGSAVMAQAAMPSPAGAGLSVTPATGAVRNAGDVPSIQSGLDSAKPAPGVLGRLYVASDTLVLYRDNGSAWEQLACLTQAQADARYVQLTGGTMTGRLYADAGLRGGYVSATSPARVSSDQNMPIFHGVWMPRTADLNDLLVLDYQDALAYRDQYGSITVTPTPSSGTAESLLRDDASNVFWASGTSPGTITITIDSRGYPPPFNSNLTTWVLGLTNRSASYTASPTHIKIEVIEATDGSYVTKYDADVTQAGAGACWISPRFGTASFIYALRVTLTMPTPLPADFRLQRVTLYHPTTDWDPWRLHVRGGDVFGPIRASSAVRAADSVVGNDVLSLAGSGYVNLGRMPQLDGHNQFTICAWVKPSTSFGGAVFSKHVSGSNRVHLGINTNVIYAYICNGVDGYMRNTSFTHPSGWYHLAYVYDGTGATNTDRCKIYVNGTPVTLTPYGTGYSVPATLGNLSSVDGNLGYSSSGWTGSIADARIYTVALSAADIALLAKQAGEPTATPLRHYRLDEGMGSMVRDRGSAPRYSYLAGGYSWGPQGYAGFGVRVPPARVSLPGGTTRQDGIAFGNDTWLYRSAAGTLTLEGTLAGATIDASRIRGVDVDSTAPTSGQVLRHNGTLWVPATLVPSDAGAAPASHTHVEADVTDLDHDAVRLQGRDIASTAPSSGQVLKWNGSQWAPATDQTGAVATMPGIKALPTESDGSISGVWGDVNFSVTDWVQGNWAIGSPPDGNWLECTETDPGYYIVTGRITWTSSGFTGKVTARLNVRRGAPYNDVISVDRQSVVIDGVSGSASLSAIVYIANGWAVGMDFLPFGTGTCATVFDSVGDTGYTSLEARQISI